MDIFGKKEILIYGPAGSPFIIFKFAAASAIAILLNVTAIAIHAVRSTNGLDFFKENWVGIVGSNCLVLFLLLAVPAIIIAAIAHGETGVEETGFDLVH